MREKQLLSLFNISGNLQESNYISDIFWTFKSKLQRIHAATYIHCFFLTLINVFLICLVPYIHICLYYFLILCSRFHLLFLTLLAARHILKFAMFDSISSQLAHNITDMTKTLHSPGRKKERS